MLKWHNSRQSSVNNVTLSINQVSTLLFYQANKGNNLFIAIICISQSLLITKSLSSTIIDTISYSLLDFRICVNNPYSITE